MKSEQEIRNKIDKLSKEIDRYYKEQDDGNYYPEPIKDELFYDGSGSASEAMDFCRALVWVLNIDN